jgi:hypothetical protein
LLSDLDHGVRCDRHVGEAFRVRCFDCDEMTSAMPTPRVGYVIGSECSTHPFYPMPCERCARDQEEA